MTPLSDTMPLSSDENDDDVVRITLRMPRALHHRLLEDIKGGVSMNSEIVRRLMESMPMKDAERRFELMRLMDRRDQLADQLERLSDRLVETEANIKRLRAAAPEEPEPFDPRKPGVKDFPDTVAWKKEPR